MHGQELLLALLIMGAAAGVGTLVAAATARLRVADPPAPTGSKPARAAAPRQRLGRRAGEDARQPGAAPAGGVGRRRRPRRLADAGRGDAAQLRRRREGDAALLDQWRREVPPAAAPGEVRALVRRSVRDILAAPPAVEVDTRPEVVLVVGVNGVGKTTTIGKLAHRYRQAGRKVLLVAGDTFRAAAIEQLDAVGGAGRRRHRQAPARRRPVRRGLRRHEGGGRRATSTSSSSTPPAACTSRRT